MERVAFVTGGMGGLGESICVKLAEAGYRVATTFSPSNSKAEDWLAQMNKNGYGFLGVYCDVVDYDCCQKAVVETQEKLGPIDILINNAGITRDMTFKKMD